MSSKMQLNEQIKTLKRDNAIKRNQITDLLQQVEYYKPRYLMHRESTIKLTKEVIRLKEELKKAKQKQRKWYHIF